MNIKLGILHVCRGLVLAAIFVVTLINSTLVNIEHDESLQQRPLPIIEPAIILKERVTAPDPIPAQAVKTSYDSDKPASSEAIDPAKSSKATSAQNHLHLVNPTASLINYSYSASKVEERHRTDPLSNLEVPEKLSAPASISAMSTATVKLNASTALAVAPPVAEAKVGSLEELSRPVAATCNRNITRSYQLQSVNEEHFIITQLAYADMLLSDEMFVYHFKNQYYIPLEFIVEQLLLPIQLDMESKSAHGWFLSEQRQINISQKLMQYWTNNEDCRNDNTAVFFDDWDIYIDAQVLSQMFGLNISFDSARQKYSIDESDNIPLSQLIARQKRFDKFNAQKANLNSGPFKVITPQYSNLGDLALNMDLGLKSRTFDNHNTVDVNGSAQARIDVLGHSSYVSYSWSDYDRSLMGYVDKKFAEGWVNQYRFGNISSHNLGLVSESSSGLGAWFSAGAEFTNDLRHIVIEGEVEPGWDVELYRNNGLIDVQRVKADGIYRFNQVPYYLGLNQYQLRLYGPNGEIKTESFSKLLDTSVMEQGEIGVSAGIMSREQDDLQQYYTDINWAVLDNLTAGVALIQQQDSDENWQFFPKLSVSVLGGSELIQLNYVHSNRGHAASVEIQGRLEALDWQAQWQNYHQFNSWDNADGRIKQQIDASLSGYVDGKGLNWGVVTSWKDYQNGNEESQVNFNLSGQMSVINWSNDLRWSALSQQQRWTERFAISGRLGKWSLRSYVELDLEPELEFKQWIANMNAAINDVANYQLELRYRPNAKGEFSTRNSLSYLFDYGTLRLALDNESSGDWMAQLRWNSGLLWESDSQRWLVDRMSFINTGSVKIIAFQDDNANGLFDPDELPLAGLQFSGHRNDKDKTDDAGEILITQLQTSRSHKLALQERSLPDPFLVPAASIISVNAHSGYIQPILFPVMFTAEIEGYVIKNDKGNRRTAKGVEVTLQSINGTEQYYTRVEYDGVFILEQIVPDKYELWIDNTLYEVIDLKPGAFIQLDEIVL
ncbi:carboxypeptidase regulatory-like domain-containing protein [Shewanella youngdeokensis]|uniref:Carboxypeptidase regulatory-like domain-containing protein n=1 Tax=Shewanella youngdeokensis TaxID=2999068 RepID=A0ABZ0K283_9GAMM|nr:carboxypeptidase regulatory-like domain-containing protein [Shewanella sp. DAU334]